MTFAKLGEIQQEYVLCTIEWRDSIPVRIVYTIMILLCYIRINTLSIPLV